MSVSCIFSAYFQNNSSLEHRSRLFLFLAILKISKKFQASKCFFLPRKFLGEFSEIFQGRFVEEELQTNVYVVVFFPNFSSFIFESFFLFFFLNGSLLVLTKVLYLLQVRTSSLTFLVRRMNHLKDELKQLIIFNSTNSINAVI